MATINDVAREAGVSKATVSKVINKKGSKIPISEITIKKVLEAATRLNYTPNRIAQNLRTGLTNCIGFLLCERLFSNKHYYVLLKYIESELANNGKNLIFSIYNPEDDLPHMLKERAVDGLLLAGRVTKDVVEKIQETNIPFLVIGSMADEAYDVNSLSGDTEKNVYAIFDYLLERGHRDIIYLSDYKEPLLIKKVFTGYQQAFIAHNLNPKPDQIKTIEDPYRDINNIFTEDLEATAIVTHQHFLNTLIYIIQQKGMNIPDQISVFLFGDDFLDSWQKDYFTYLPSDSEQIATESVKYIMKLCNNEIEKVYKLISGKIRTGKTVKDIL